jgi:predicted nucleotidyltransferase
MRAEPSLRRLVDPARERLHARQVWLFGSRARGDARPESDWDIWLILPIDAPDADLDPATTWRIGRDAGLIADVVADRETRSAGPAVLRSCTNRFACGVSSPGRRGVLEIDILIDFRNRYLDPDLRQIQDVLTGQGQGGEGGIALLAVKNQHANAR